MIGRIILKLMELTAVMDIDTVTLEILEYFSKTVTRSNLNYFFFPAKKVLFICYAVAV